ncbi:MAG TPA: UbiA family prenyltransferase, partial [Solirubrobacterales bacterium]|nr:UbiA family prenyltransferase [Solirubrobacterales bacterium]
NNVRDLETDRRAGKMTLAVRIGRHNAVMLYRALMLGAFVVLPIALLAGEASALPLVGLLALPLTFAPMRAMTNRSDGPALNGALAATGAVLGVYSLLVSAGLLISA